MRARAEPWGAWVKLDDPPMLVGIDREGAQLLGLDGGARWGDAPPPSPPLEAHVAVTSRCGAGCEGCYLDATPDGREPPRAEIEGRLADLARAGIFTVAFGGGEPTTRRDLGELADLARALGLQPVVTTSGLGLTAKKLDALARFDQVNVSYDGDGARYAEVRGFDAAAEAEAAIRALAARGVDVGVNVVLTRATFAHLGGTLARARGLGAREAQLLRYKPAGRAASVTYLDRRLSRSQARALGPTLRRLSAELPGFGLRIDCALVPFLSADPSIDPADLSRFGVFGCEASAALVAVRADGRLAPCSFAPPSTLRTSAIDHMHADVELSAWRGPAGDAEPCRGCPLGAVCKGGCKVVSRFTGGALGADPECPRVLTARPGQAPEGGA